MKLVALAGRSGVGKNTIADLLFKPHGYFDVSLAEDLKIRAIGAGVATYEDVFIGCKPDVVRTWLQQEGTERGRDLYGTDVWVRSLFARLRRIEESWGLAQFVITDVRFVNEIQYIRQRGGIVLRVDAPQRNAQNGMSAEQRQHSSETEIDQCPLSLLNGVILNDPEYDNTLRWQVEAHLYLAKLRAVPPAPLNRDAAYKIHLLTRMLPNGVTRAAS